MPKYIVVLTPPKPATRDTQRGMSSVSYTVGEPVQVKRIDARSPQEAAEKAGVPAGGKAEVIAVTQVRTFTRAVQAPLEEDGPQEAVRAA